MPVSAKVQAALTAMQNMGMGDDKKTKTVLKKLLRVYDKNWKMIEEGNYTVLVNAILDDDFNGAALVNEDTPEKISESAPEDTTPSQRRSGFEEEESERPLKRLRKVHGAANAGPSSEAVGLSVLMEPKPEPLDEGTCLDAAVSKKKGKQPLETVPQSVPLVIQGEPAAKPARKTSRVNLEIAASSKGEVKVFVTCLQKANFCPPKLEEAIRYMEEKHLDSYKAIDPEFSVRKVVKDFCECFLELATRPAIAEPEEMMNIVSATPKDGNDVSGGSPDRPLSVIKPAIANGNDVSGGRPDRPLSVIKPAIANGNDVSGGSPDMPLSVIKPAIANGSKNAAEASVLVSSQFHPLDCVPANGEVLDAPSGSKDAHDILKPNSWSLVVAEPQHIDLYDELRLVYNASDISRGEEKVNISLLTESDSGPLPSFYYMSHNVVYCDAHLNISLGRIGDRECCPTCSGDCSSSSSPCMCSSPCRGGFSYTSEGLLKEEFLNGYISIIRHSQKHHLARCRECPLEKYKNDNMPKACKGHLDRKFIRECWIKCGCSKSCVNRVVQRGISCRLQVFWTPEGKGWGLRTLDELPKGAFVCEFVGEVLTISELHQRSLQSKNDKKHSYAAILDADWSSKNLQDNQTLCLDSTFYGNAARFINHRCLDANLIEIPVQVETPDRHYYHVAFFTTRKIEANEELTWDYGVDFDGQDSYLNSFPCLCGSSSCRNMKCPNGSMPTSVARIEG